MGNPRLVGFLLVVLATASWSTSGIFINWTVGDGNFTPVTLAFWRDLTTFLVLFVGIGLVKPSLLRVAKKDLPWLIMMGMISIGSFHVLWNMNVLVNGAAVATVLQCNAPIFVTVIAWLAWREPFSGRKIAAIVLAVIGILLISRLDQLSGMTLTVEGIVVGLLSAITYGTFSIFGKRLSGSYDMWTILVYVFGFATLTLLPFQAGSSVPWPVPFEAGLSFAALILVPTIAGFGLYTMALKRLQASVAAITATTEVPFAAVLAFFLLSERLDGWQIVGALLVVVGVILLSLPKRTQSSLVIPAQTTTSQQGD
jgi:drug/metabolite transporter (DMT)-like permease